MPPHETIAAIATPPGTGGIGILRLSGARALAIGEAISTAVGLDADLGALANLTSGGVLRATGNLDLNVTLGVDLTDPSQVSVFDIADPLLGGGLNVTGDNLVFRASLGPLGVFIRDGDANQEDLTNDAVEVWQTMPCFRFEITDNVGVDHFAIASDPGVLDRLLANLGRPKSVCP